MMRRLAIGGSPRGSRLSVVTAGDTTPVRGAVQSGSPDGLETGTMLSGRAPSRAGPRSSAAPVRPGSHGTDWAVSSPAALPIGSLPGYPPQPFASLEEIRLAPADEGG